MATKKQPRMKKIRTGGQTYSASLDRINFSRLDLLVSEESKFFNKLVTAIGSYCRAFPTDLVNLEESTIRLFGELSFHMISADQFLKLDELPKAFKQYSDILQGETVMGRRLLSGSTLALLNMANQPGYVDRLIRKRIAESVLRYHIHQAKKLTHCNPESFRVFSHFNLQSPNSAHLSRGSVKIEWDDNQNTSLIHSRYFTNPIRVQDVDLTKLNKWDMIRLSAKDFNLTVNFVHSGGSYLINYTTLATV